MNTNESNSLSSNSQNNSRIKHKIIFLGDQHVGKTCIIERFMYDVFDEKSHPTIGVDFLAKTMHIEDKNIRLQLWDTAGQERFRSLIPSYLRDATCAVIVYDVTEKVTFTNVDRWIQDYKENRGVEAPFILVANKIDMKQTREISQSEGEQKAQSYKMNYYEISAKTGENIVNMFKLMATSLQPIENSILNPGLTAAQNYQIVQNNTNNKSGNQQQQQQQQQQQEQQQQTAASEQHKKKIVLNDNNNKTDQKQQTCC